MHFRLEGVPLGADAREVARFAREIGWPAVPHRKTVTRTGAVWWVTAEQQPKDLCVIWSKAHVLITPISDDEKNKGRSFEKSKKTKDVLETRSQETAKEMKTTDEQADVLQKKDPWSRWMKDDSRHSRITTTPSSSSASRSPTLEADPRLASLSMRMDRMEQAHGQLKEKVDKVDGQISGLNEQMNEQFKKVMMGLQSLQQKKGAGASQEQS